jgi:hypothetical protein
VVESPAPRRGRRGRAGTLKAIALVATTAVGAVGCTDATAEGAALRLPGSAHGLDALGEQVLGALVRGDTAALRGFRLTEAEHKEVVWPELPASRPEVNYPVDAAWRNIELRDHRAVGRLLPMFEGRSVTFRRVECRGGTREFASFRVASDCWVVFDAVGSDRRWEAQLFKDVLVRGGGHKVFRYYEEEPRPLGPTSGGGP